MANSSRSPGGRFSSRKVNTHPKPPPRISTPPPKSDDDSNKKRRLNDGSSQKIVLSAEKQPSTTQPPAPPTDVRQETPTNHQAIPVRSTRQISQQNATPAKSDEKRKLRSQDSTRRKSELLNFFADFETVVFGLPKTDDAITPNTPLLVTNKPPHPSIVQRLDEGLPTPSTLSRPEHPSRDAYPLSNNALSREMLPIRQKRQHTGPLFRKIKLPARSTAPRHTDVDLLSDELYEVAHRRGERKEKQSRNWDKERALHEKGELERLLQELRGPDWLKVMGIIGVSEIEGQKFKSKRSIFIKRAQTMLDRYAAWNKRDRELKLEREQRLTEEDESSSGDDESDRTAETSTNPGQKSRHTHQAAQVRDQERSQPTTVQEKAFTTFFEKPHMREAAMGSHRRGRNVLAFGVPIPEMPEVADFELPKDIAAAAGQSLLS